MGYSVRSASSPCRLCNAEVQAFFFTTTANLELDCDVVSLNLQQSAGKMASQSGQVDLLEYIDFRSVECLNQQPAHAIGNALKQVRAKCELQDRCTQLHLVKYS